MSENNKTAFEPPVLTVLSDHEFDQNIVGESNDVSWFIGNIPEL